LEAAKHTKEEGEMAHHEGEATAIGHALEVLSEHGLEGMAEAIQTLLNETMKIERALWMYWERVGQPDTKPIPRCWSSQGAA
jgi:hypothetical protein